MLLVCERIETYSELTVLRQKLRQVTSTSTTTMCILSNFPSVASSSQVLDVSVALLLYSTTRNSRPFMWRWAKSGVPCNILAYAVLFLIFLSRMRILSE